MNEQRTEVKGQTDSGQNGSWENYVMGIIKGGVLSPEDAKRFAEKIRKQLGSVERLNGYRGFTQFGCRAITSPNKDRGYVLVPNSENFRERYDAEVREFMSRGARITHVGIGPGQEACFAWRKA